MLDLIKKFKVSQLSKKKMVLLLLKDNKSRFDADKNMRKLANTNNEYKKSVALRNIFSISKQKQLKVLNQFKDLFDQNVERKKQNKDSLKKFFVVLNKNYSLQKNRALKDILLNNENKK